MPVLLQTWTEFITDCLSPEKLTLIPLSEDDICEVLARSQDERKKVQGLLIEGIVDRPEIRDKQQFVQVNQTFLIRLLDKVYGYKKTPDLQENLVQLYSALAQHIEDALGFIEDFLSNYFDRNERVPVSYFHVFADELYHQLQSLEGSLNSSIDRDQALIAILVANFKAYCRKEKANTTYNELGYQRNLMSELLSLGANTSEATVREILYLNNFNDDDYVAYTYRKLGNLLEGAGMQVKKEMITALRYEQKIVNQFRTKPNTGRNPHMPSLKEQVNQWIEEEIKYLEAGPGVVTQSKHDAEPEDKIQTSLSVAKLALLLKLMVIDKIIVNRVVAQMLRITVKTVATLQKENIAFGSLETKYHNPDRGTISAVKEMLFRWINILNKL